MVSDVSPTTFASRSLCHGVGPPSQRTRICLSAIRARSEELRVHEVCEHDNDADVVQAPDRLQILGRGRVTRLEFKPGTLLEYESIISDIVPRNAWHASSTGA